MQATAAAAPFLLTTAARRLLALHLLPVLAAWTLLAWACTALASACCVCRIERRRCPSLVVLYAHCVGGYHSDLQQAWRGLEQAVAVAAPEVKWHQLQRFTLMFDDQVNWPAECCRAALGFVVASGGADPQHDADAWRSHPLVTTHWLHLRVGVFPSGVCLAAADLPHCGPLSYMVSLVPGLLELRDPAARLISFLLPLEPRTDLLPF